MNNKKLFRKSLDLYIISKCFCFKFVLEEKSYWRKSHFCPFIVSWTFTYEALVWMISMTGCIITVQRESAPKLSKDISAYLKFILSFIFQRTPKYWNIMHWALVIMQEISKCNLKTGWVFLSYFLAGNELAVIMKLSSFLHYHNYLRLQHFCS